MHGHLLPDCASIANSLRQSRSLLVAVQIEPAESVAASMGANMVFNHAGHRLELPSSVPAAWVAELLQSQIYCGAKGFVVDNTETIQYGFRRLSLALTLTLMV